MVSALEGKTELFQKKMTKKGPKTGSGGITPVGTISQFFHHFQGFLKIQVEITRVGKHSSIFALRIYTKKYIQFFGALENIYNIYNKISIYNTKIDYCIGVVYLVYSLRILVRKLHFRAPSACVLHFGNHAPSASSLHDVIVKCLYDVV